MKNTTNISCSKLQDQNTPIYLILHLSGIIISIKNLQQIYFSETNIPPAPKKISKMVLAGGSDSNGHDNNMIINKNLKGKKGILVIEMLLFMIKYLYY